MTYNLIGAKRIGTVDEGEFWKFTDGKIILITWEMFENGLVTES